VNAGLSRVKARKRRETMVLHHAGHDGTAGVGSASHDAKIVSRETQAQKK